MKSVATSSEGRLPVKFNALGQPIGKASISLSSFLGPLVREVVPVTLPDWRKITLGMKEVLWRSIQARYIVDKEWKKNYIFQSMGDLWRASKSRLVAKVKKAPNEHERLKLKPDNIKTVIEWRAFIKEKTSLEFQAKSDKFKEIRNKRLPHTCSRKGYARLIDDMEGGSFLFLFIYCSVDILLIAYTVLVLCVKSSGFMNYLYCSVDSFPNAGRR
uniref:Uncharacterized protein n=1 Tax=Cannabis sativa TaxID=3483 RepID=A0A803NRS9_CANSA